MAYLGIFEFQSKNNRLPGNSEDDFNAVLAAAKRINEENKANGNGITVDELDEKVI